MFSENKNNHYQLHLARKKELESVAQMQRLSSAVAKENGIALRKRIGTTLISLGKKLAQESEQDTRMTFAAQR